MILSQFQSIAPGHVLPALPGATDAFVVLAVDAPRSLVLGGPPDSAGHQRATWTFLLVPLEGGRTRLIVRGRVSDQWLAASGPRESVQPKRFIEHAFMSHLPKPILLGFAGLGHRTMQNEQLRGLKRRVERTRRAYANAAPHRVTRDRLDHLLTTEVPADVRGVLDWEA